MELKNKFLGQLLLKQEINDGLFIWRYDMDCLHHYEMGCLKNDFR